MVFNKQMIQSLNALIPPRSKYSTEMKKVVKLYEERHIHSLREAEKTIDKLASKNKQSNIIGLERLEKHTENVPLPKTLITRRLNEKNKYEA